MSAKGALIGLGSSFAAKARGSNKRQKPWPTPVISQGQNPVTQSEWLSELTARQAAFGGIIERKGCDLGLIYGSLERNEPFRYLTNFVPVLGDMWGILHKGKMSCFLNFHWQLEEAKQVSGLENWHGIFDLIPPLSEELAALAPRKIAVFGLERIPWTAAQMIQKRLPNAEWVSCDPEFDLIRRIKSPLEIRLLREAVRVTDIAIDQARTRIKPGVSEIELASLINYSFNQQGAAPAFFSTVMAGVDQPAIIRTPRPYVFRPGDSVMMDVGAVYQGYQADVARTFVIGRPSPIQRKIWDTVSRAYDAVIKAARPGIPCNQLHKTAAAVFEKEGFHQAHRIGHGIGLATSFEWPSLDTETALLEPGMTMAIEPGIYVKGADAIKIEDDILITEKGCEVLSRASRDWIIPE
jgi:Xaa-Pro aminopeptidase